MSSVWRKAKRRLFTPPRHDGATGLANRSWTATCLERFQTEAQANRAAFGLALIDLDYFKAVNDTLGHAAGDAVILAVAERLKAMGSALRLAARLGGDEFIAVSPEFAAPDDLEPWAEAVRLALMQPVMFDGNRIDVSTSIGAALYQSGSVKETLKQADLVMYRAKRDGRGCMRIFDPALDRPDGGTTSNVDQLRAMAEKLRPGSASAQPQGLAAAF